MIHRDGGFGIRASTGINIRRANTFALWKWSGGPNVLAVPPVAETVPAQPQPPAKAHSMRRSEQGDSVIGEFESANDDQTFPLGQFTEQARSTYTKKTNKKNKIRSGIITGIVALGIA